MRIRRLLVVSLVAVAVVAAGAPTSQAAPAPVQFNLTKAFNADVIVNKGATGLDGATPVDASNYAFATQAAAVNVGCGSASGLPNGGFFAKNAGHPAIQLAYRNSKNGKNARKMAADGQFTFPVARKRYSQVHVLVMSAESDSEMRVKFNYRNGTSTTKDRTVDDWFDDPSAGEYALFNDGDRVEASNPFTCDDVDTVAIWGFKLTPRSGRVLKSITIRRTDDDGSILTVFGATGVPAS